MHPWEALSPHDLRPAGEITAAFLNLAKPDLPSAARYVCELPYGRNSDPGDPFIVLREMRGTCSTKHALLRRLAIEQHLDLSLFLGIYEMSERNTPGVGRVLQRYGLPCIPEAHSYLRSGDRLIDLTRRSEDPREPIAIFLHEEEIAPTQITHYKIGVHKSFLTKWIADNGNPRGLSLEEAWRIREECIASLSPPAPARHGY